MSTRGVLGCVDGRVGRCRQCSWLVLSFGVDDDSTRTHLVFHDLLSTVRVGLLLLDLAGFIIEPTFVQAVLDREATITLAWRSLLPRLARTRR